MFQPGGLAQRAQSVAGSVVAALPASLRSRAERLVTGPAGARLAAALEQWGRGAGLSRAAFADRFFGRESGDKLAGQLHDAAKGITAATSFADLRMATEQLAGAIQAVGVDGWSRFLTNAQDHAASQPPMAQPIPTAADATLLLARAAAQARMAPHQAGPQANRHQPGSHVTTPGGHEKHETPGEKKEREAKLRAANIEGLARIIQSEIGGHSEGYAAVGWAVRNRMLRNGKDSVAAVHSGFAHGSKPEAEARSVAQGILDSKIPDQTNGVTHFYTPSRMPKEGDRNIGANMDIDGGLEQVPMVVDHDGNPVKSYRPGWANTFEQIIVPGVPDYLMKFYKQNGHGHVH